MDARNSRDLIELQELKFLTFQILAGFLRFQGFRILGIDKFSKIKIYFLKNFFIDKN